MVGLFPQCVRCGCSKILDRNRAQVDMRLGIGRANGFALRVVSFRVGDKH